MSVARFAPPGGRGQQTMDHTEAFRAELAHLDGVAVVHFVGELDNVARAQAWEVLCNAAQVTPVVIVDLAELEFMDSTGLSVLLETRQLPGVERVVIRNPPEMVQRLIEITALDTVFDIDEPRA
jgi:anti-sigma B factor antagonist